MINLRCLYCQTPFTVGRSEMLTALITMEEKGQNHYDAHCPRCRRANSISRQRMELFFPNWKEAAKQAASAPAQSEPASANLKTEPLPKAAKSTAAKAAGTKKPAAGGKSSTAKKPASTTKKTPSSTAKTTKTTTSKPKKK